MSYGALRIRVEAAERAFDSRIAETEAHWETLRTTTRRAMTPGRLIGTGFLTGALVGFTEPLKKLGGGQRLMQLATSVIAFIGALEAKAAAADATDAADTATEVAVAVDPVVAEAVEAENAQVRIDP